MEIMPGLESLRNFLPLLDGRFRYAVEVRHHSCVSANQDEEVWIESIYYRDRQHMNEVMKKMKKDERTGQMMKQSMDLLPQGAKFIVGHFERLNV
jgi:uncharacterized protein YbaA (DUF1428 family)